MNIARCHRPTLAHRLMLSLGASLLIACGPERIVATDPGTVSLAISQSTATVQRGSYGALAATITRNGAFAGAVTLAVSGMPVGVTSSVVYLDTQLGVTKAVVYIYAGAAAVSGEYELAVHAGGAGIEGSTVPLSLSITPVPPPPPTQSYTLAIVGTVRTAERGTTLSVTVNLVRTNFDGAVALSVDNPPAGVAITFFRPTQPFMTVQIAASVPVGTYVLVVRGVATGLADRTATLTLSVTDPPLIIGLPPALSLAQGSTNAVTVNLVRNHDYWSAELWFALDEDGPSSAMPAGISAKFTPNPTTLNHVVLTITAASNVTPGVYPLTLWVSPDDHWYETAPLTLTITAAAPAAWLMPAIR